MTKRRISPWLILGAIMLFGLCLRVAYLAELLDAPDFRVPLRDAAFHDYWARGIAFGEWSPPADDPDPRIRAVPFLRPPGYSYFLAGVYAVSGGDYLAARIAQMLLGLLNAVLAYLLGRAVFNRAVGFILATFCAGYWTLIYFEGELQAPVLTVTLGLTLLLSLSHWRCKPTGWRALIAGLALGALALTRANVLAFIPVAMLWIVWLARGPGLRRHALAHAGLLMLGTLLAVAPVTIRNAVVSGDFVPISVNGEINLLIGNNAQSTATSVTIPNLEAWTGTNRWGFFLYDEIVRGLSRQEGRQRSYAEAGDYFSRQALDYIRTHPGRTARRWLERAVLFWGPAEVSSNKTIALEKSNSPLLRVQPGFPVVLTTALFGLSFLLLGDRWLPRRFPARNRAAAPAADRPMLLLIGLFILTYFVSFLPFIAAARFRAPLLPLVSLFGAYGLYRAIQIARARMWGPLAIAGLLAAALFALSSRPLVAHESDPAWWHTERATALSRGGDPAAAERELLRALEANPGFVDARAKLAGVLTQLGRHEEALGHYDELLRHRPDRTDLRERRAATLVTMGAGRRALGELRALTREHPNFFGPHYHLGRALLQLGDYRGAEQALRRAVAIDPGQSHAHVYLGIALASQDDLQGALPHYRRATELDPDSPESLFNLGVALQELGQRAEAAAAFRRTLEIDPSFERARRQLQALDAERSLR